MTELAKEVLARISTPDFVESRLGRLEFKDGAPSPQTVATLYDHLDYVHAMNAFLTAFPAASTQAIRQGFLDVGAEDNTCLIFSGLMDSSSRFLTANADTVYYIMFVDLNDGPMVVETPPMALGTFDDMWFQWIIDFGLPGPDRGAGGRFPASFRRVRRPAARRRLLRRALADEPRADARSVVHGELRSHAYRRDDQVEHSRCTRTHKVDRAPVSPRSFMAARSPPLPSTSPRQSSSREPA